MESPGGSSYGHSGESPGGRGSRSSESPGGRGSRDPSESPGGQRDRHESPGGAPLRTGSAAPEPPRVAASRAPAATPLERAGALLSSATGFLETVERQLPTDSELFVAVRAARSTLTDIFGREQDAVAQSAARRIGTGRVLGYVQRTTTLFNRLARELSDPGAIQDSQARAADLGRVGEELSRLQGRGNQR